MKQQPKAILFDIGSTLWSSPPEDAGALRDCYGRGRAVLAAALPEVPPVEALIDAVEGYFAEWEDIWRDDPSRVEQAPTTVFVAEALARLDLAPPPDALQAFTDLILETSILTARTLEPEEGMPEALATLTMMGLRLACVSNAFMTGAGLQAIMDERGLGPHLAFTISSCEYGIRKPHASIYQAALQKLGVEASDAVFVGDRLDADIAGPAAVGMRTVLSHQYRQENPALAPVKPDAIISHLRELEAVIRHFGSE